eukprot:2822222-Amphidinium_carterae.1
MLRWGENHFQRALEGSCRPCLLAEQTAENVYSAIQGTGLHHMIGNARCASLLIHEMKRLMGMLQPFCSARLAPHAGHVLLQVTHNYLQLNGSLQELLTSEMVSKRYWLVAAIIKTLRHQVKLDTTVPQFPDELKKYSAMLVENYVE